MIGLLLAAVVLAGPPAASDLAAPGTAGRSPVKVDAAEVRYAFQRREVIFTGKPVTLTREDARLTCARLVAKNDEAGQIASATCEGDVRFARGQRVVTCDRATYEDGAARVTCDGNAVLRDRGSEARAKRLVYDLRSDEVKLEGGEGPVQITLPAEEVEARQRELEQRRQQRAQERKQ